MTRFLAVSSAKGGVGKTTVSLNLGVALCKLGRDIAVVDANLSSPNIALHLGFNPNVSFHDLLSDDLRLKEATYQHPSGLKIVPGCYKLKNYDTANFDKVVERLKGFSELVIFDTPPTLNTETMKILSLIGEQIVVTTPDMVSVTEALRTINFGEQHGVTTLGVVVNKMNNDEKNLPLDKIEAFVGKPVVGVIPEDNAISNSLYLKHPVNYAYPNSPASISFKKLAGELIGDRYEEQINFGEERTYLKKVKDIVVKDIFGLK